MLNRGGGTVHGYYVAHMLLNIYDELVILFQYIN